MHAKTPGAPAVQVGAQAPGGDAPALPHSPVVLLLVDFINPLSFPEAPCLAPSALRAAACTAALKWQLACQNVPAIYANDNYGRWRSEFRDVLNLCRISGGAAQQLADRLAPGPQDLTILKPRHSAFYATPLELLLAQMHTRRIVLVGLAADICVQLTAMDARMRGYDVWVPSDCTAAESADRHAGAMQYLHDVLELDTAPSTRADLAFWLARRPAAHEQDASKDATPA